jgi:hypothetical protein
MSGEDNIIESAHFRALLTLSISLLLLLLLSFEGEGSYIGRFACRNSSICVSVLYYFAFSRTILRTCVPHTSSYAQICNNLVNCYSFLFVVTVSIFSIYYFVDRESLFIIYVSDVFYKIRPIKMWK